MDIQNNAYSTFAMHDEDKYIQWAITQKSMKMYYDNVMKEENTALHFWSFKNGDGVQKVMATMADDHALRKWKLHSFKNMRWNGNLQYPIEYGDVTSL